MQAIYAWYCTDYQPAKTFEYNLEEFADEIRSHEQQKGDKGDLRLLTGLFYSTIERQEEFDHLIQAKAENWELERIALLDRILMQMGICEMLTFAEIPIKVTINEYLEIAKKFSTPKSSKFINGILDSLYIELKGKGDIEKRGRGLIEESVPKRGMPPKSRRPRLNRDGDFHGPPLGQDRYRDDRPHDRFDRQDRGPSERSGSGRPRISRNSDRPHFDRDRPPSNRFDRDRHPSDRFDRDRPPSDRYDRDRPPSDRPERKKPILRIDRNSDRPRTIKLGGDRRDPGHSEEAPPPFEGETIENPVVPSNEEGTPPEEVTPPVDQPEIESQGESPTDENPLQAESEE